MWHVRDEKATSRCHPQVSGHRIHAQIYTDLNSWFDRFHGPFDVDKLQSLGRSCHPIETIAETIAVTIRVHPSSEPSRFFLDMFLVVS
jgi:hypothetical protein